MGKTKRKQNTLEEIGNGITHGLGALFGIAALVIMIVQAAGHKSSVRIASAIIFGISIFLLYLSSTLYHSLTPPGAKKFFKLMDHSSIYVLIAGTYTPFLIVSIGGKFGWAFFVSIWALALTGIIFELLFVGRFKKTSTALYIIMGWLAVAGIKPLMENVPDGGLILLLAGGVSYTSGAVFYIWDRIPSFHFIWHIFVLSGSILHFLAVSIYVMN